VTQETGVLHVKTDHLILKPVIGKDVVYDTRVHARRRQLFRLGRDPALEVRCKRCPALPIYKLWDMHTLTLHLRTKHNIFEPIEGDDWAEVNIIAPPPTAAPESEPAANNPSAH